MGNIDNNIFFNHLNSFLCIDLNNICNDLLLLYDIKMK